MPNKLTPAELFKRMRDQNPGVTQLSTVAEVTHHRMYEAELTKKSVSIDRAIATLPDPTRMRHLKPRLTRRVSFAISAFDLLRLVQRAGTHERSEYVRSLVVSCLDEMDRRDAERVVDANNTEQINTQTVASSSVDRETP